MGTEELQLTCRDQITCHRVLLKRLGEHFIITPGKLVTEFEWQIDIDALRKIAGDVPHFSAENDRIGQASQILCRFLGVRMIGFKVLPASQQSRYREISKRPEIQERRLDRRPRHRNGTLPGNPPDCLPAPGIGVFQSLRFITNQP